MAATMEAECQADPPAVAGAGAGASEASEDDVELLEDRPVICVRQPTRVTPTVPKAVADAELRGEGSIEGDEFVCCAIALLGPQYSRGSIIDLYKFIILQLRRIAEGGDHCDYVCDKTDWYYRPEVDAVKAGARASHL